MNKKVQVALATGAAVAIVAGVVDLVKLMPYFMGSGTGAAEGLPGATSAPSDPVNQCASTVIPLLQQGLQALQNGSPNGLDKQSVELKYGSASAVFYSFASAQGDMIADALRHGAAGALDRVKPHVYTYCHDYLSQNPATSSSPGT